MVDKVDAAYEVWVKNPNLTNDYTLWILHENNNKNNNKTSLWKRNETKLKK